MVRRIDMEIVEIQKQAATGRLRFFLNGDRPAGATAVINQIRDGRPVAVKEYEVEE